MNLRRLFALVFVCALAFGAPVLLEAAGSGGAATNFAAGICYWQCNNGTAGSGPASNGRQCLNLCAGACGGPCIALY